MTRYGTLLLALALLPAPPAAAEEIQLADLPTPIVGEVSTMDGESLALAGSGETYPAARVLAIDFGGGVSPAPGEATLVLRGGDELRGTPTGGDRTRAELQSRALGKLQVPLADLAEVRFAAEEGAGRVIVAGEEEDVLYLADGDYLTGTVDSFSPGVTFASKAVGGLRTFAFDKLARITFADFGTSKIERTGRQVLCYLRDGSRISASFLGLAQGVVELHTASGRASKVQRAALATLVFQDGEFAYVSDLEPLPASRDNILPFASAVTYPHRRDRAVLGGPLAISSRTYAKGLGVHSRSILHFSLAEHPSMRRFLATVGLDPCLDILRSEERIYGSVIFRVRSGTPGEDAGDTPVVFESPVMRIGDAPLEMGPVELRGEVLILEVDYADNYHVQDRAAWGAARIVP